MEKDEPHAKRSRLADEWSESESDDDSDDDGGDDFESISDDDGHKPCLDISREDFDRAFARGYGCKDGSHSSVLPAQHIVSIQCQISRASLREKNTFLLGLLAAVQREETLSHARRAGVPVRTRSRFDYIMQGLPNCLCLWKVVEAETLTENLPYLMSTSLLLMGTKAKCPGISCLETLDRVILFFF